MVSLLHHQTLHKWSPNDFSVAPSTDRKSCAQTTEQGTLLPSVCLPSKPNFQTVPAHKYISQEEIPDATCTYSHPLRSLSHIPGVDSGLRQLWELLFIPPRWVLLMDRAGLSWFLSPEQVWHWGQGTELPQVFPEALAAESLPQLGQGLLSCDRARVNPEISAGDAQPGVLEGSG